MRQLILSLCLAIGLAAALLLTGCSKPWTHPNYSGAAEDRQFKIDSLDCEVIAGKEFPIEKRKQNARFFECMAAKGWDYHPDGQGYQFQTKPR
ncbi:hypothetical protein [Pseudodesulfovibrio sediminis]|uniref:Lipoprotein n=1 Tax=Pseudodesulfovibrio sediminis TaxID=2810563 RepID=A0ABM7P6K7_9BACT|nr:hypothetical protein [Pseudodesulfovibrio sediminis]BCS88560.1 hypothetical protein PSDVSF_18020 [Pseudodesulfovibrio sediminis]